MPRLHATHVAKAMTQNHLRESITIRNPIWRAKREKKRHKLRWRKIGRKKGDNGDNPRNSCSHVGGKDYLTASKPFFWPNACSKKSGSAQQATRKCLGSEFSLHSKLHPNFSISLSPFLVHSKRPSLLPTITLPVVHDFTWPTCTEKDRRRWKAIFEMMKHLHSLHPYPMYNIEPHEAVPEVSKGKVL